MSSKLMIPGPAVQKAFAFVKENLDRGIWQSGERLPPVRRLALGADVSAKSMIKAVALLKSKGLVRGFERGRMRAGSDSTPAAVPATEETALWHTKRIELEKDILSGAYAQEGKLPSFKELATTYDVGYRTLRKILYSMAADNVIRPKGRRYELPNTPSRPFQQRIVFLTHHIQPVPRSALNPGQYRIFDLLEYECIRRNLQLEIVEIDLSSTAEISRAASNVSLGTPALGYIFDLWWYHNEEFRRSLANLLSRLSALKISVAILDEIGDLELPVQFASNPLFQVFRIEGKQAGSRIARFLLGMGHRSSAYICSAHENVWSKQRLNGVMDQHTKAGCVNGVKTVVAEKIEINREYTLAISGFDKELIREILSIGRNKTATDDVFRVFLKYREKLPAQPFTSDDIQWIRKKMNIIKSAYREDPSDNLFSRICEDVFAEIGMYLSLKVNSPLFEQALEFQEVTAWICASDGIALSALSFLRGQSIKVPKELSVVGFDNQPVEALEHGLTSFDFNASGFVHRMLNFIVHPPKPQGPFRHSPIEVEGIIVQRDTTAPPKKGTC